MLFEDFKVGDIVKVDRLGKGDPLVRLRSVGDKLGVVVEVEPYRIFKYAVKFDDMPPIKFADHKITKVNGVEKATKRQKEKNG